MMIGCPMDDLIGLETGGPKGCVSNCSCSSERFSPVCGSDGNTYFSACHAGCRGYSMKDDVVQNVRFIYLISNYLITFLLTKAVN